MTEEPQTTTLPPHSVSELDGGERESTSPQSGQSQQIGDGPTQPKWMLVVTFSAWLGWVGFLIVMMISRLNGPDF